MLTPVTNCECVLAGLCPRHNVKKHDHWVKLCQQDPEYFQAWEAGTGPGQKIANTEPPCPHLISGNCEIVSEIATVPFQPSKAICYTCTNAIRPRRLNYYTLTVAYKLNPELDISAMQDVVDGKSSNFGTRLSNTIGFVFRSGNGCGCDGHKDILDVWTPKYIEDNLEKVIDWLQNEAKTRKIPFSRVLTRILLKRLL